MACPSITLGGVVLPPSLLWRDEIEFSPVAQTVKRTLGGSLIVYTGGLTAGQPITLVSVPDQGWLTKAQVDAIRVLADIPGNIMSLVIGSQTFSVMFRHQEQPAFKAEPLIFRVDSPSTDYFLATIKLMKVA